MSQRLLVVASNSCAAELVEQLEEAAPGLHAKDVCMCLVVGVSCPVSMSTCEPSVRAFRPGRASLLGLGAPCAQGTNKTLASACVPACLICEPPQHALMPAFAYALGQTRCAHACVYSQVCTSMTGLHAAILLAAYAARRLAAALALSGCRERAWCQILHMRCCLPTVRVMFVANRALDYSNGSCDFANAC